MASAQEAERPLPARWRMLAALASGVCYGLAAPGFGVWPLAFVALLPLVWTLDRHALRPGQAAAWGLLAGTLAQLVALYWLAPMGSRFFQVSAWVAWPLTALFGMAQAGQLGLFAGLFAWLRPRLRSPTGALVLALGVAEAVWPMLFRLQLGHALHGLPRAIQLADVGGVALVSLLVGLTSGALYELVLSRAFLARPRRGALVPCAAAVLAWLGSLGYASFRIAAVEARVHAAPRARLGIVQANVSPREKLADPNGNLRRHLALTRELERTGPSRCASTSSFSSRPGSTA